MERSATEALPFTASELDAIYLRFRKHLPTSGSGEVRRRELGQSLQYREHRAYVPGDDVRHVDWRASARQGRENEFLLRSYEAEEELALAIVVDPRATMRLPQGASKLRFALWIVIHLAQILARETVRATLVSLYDDVTRRPAFFRSDALQAEAIRFSRRLELAEPPSGGEGTGSAENLVSSLPPSGATIIISDFYMADLGPVLELARRARRGYRQLVLCSLDTWPMERAMLENQMVRLKPVGATPGRGGEYQPTSEQLDEAQAKIEARINEMRSGTQMSGVTHLPWRAEGGSLDEAGLREAFRAWFYDFAPATQLLARRR
jgi:uncharacterized protein (DUF58 family)